MESSNSGGGAGGELELGFTEIETVADGLEKSTVFHLLKDIIGFVLYMHQQIPGILQQLEDEYAMLKKESKDLGSVLTQPELNATSRRKQNARIREVKHGVKRMEKLMNSISTLLSSLQLVLNELPNIDGVILALGGSLFRPLYVYEMSFSSGKVAAESEKEWTKSRAAEALSRKAIRALVSNGAGSGSYEGPAKLFLLVRAPANLNLAQHFLPKRDFRYSKKIVPFRLHIKCRSPDQYMGKLHHTFQHNHSGIPDMTSNDMIWFQCRHTIKGLASRPLTEE